MADSPGSLNTSFRRVDDQCPKSESLSQRVRPRRKLPPGSLSGQGAIATAPLDSMFTVAEVGSPKAPARIRSAYP